MSYKCCVSLRGLAYFGASTHIVVGAMFFVEFLESLFSISQSKMVQSDTINVGTERLVYHWMFLSLGLLIFQGIDRESKTILKRSAVIFLILQALTLAVRLKYYFLTWSPYLSDLKEDNGSDISPRGFSLGMAATGAYLLILFLYVRKLESSIHGRVIRQNSAAAATHIPLSTTNVGWCNQSQSSRRGGGNNSSSSALYSPLNFFGGVVGAAGFGPLVWTNPGPPPPYSDTAPPSESQLSRSLPPVHSHTIQPCSSRTLMNPPTSENSDKTLVGTRTSERTESDPSVVPLLEDDNEDNKSGLEC